MDEVAIRVAVREMVRAMVKSGNSEGLFAALREAAPKVAAGHLQICYSDKSGAGLFLSLCDDATGETLLEKYLFGSPEPVLENFRSYVQALISMAPADLPRPKGRRRRR